MPVFLGHISTTQSYGIILLQQACGVPGVIISTWLVETRLGRKYTIVGSFSVAGICCCLFCIEPNVISVGFYLDYHCNKCYEFFDHSWI